MIEMAKRFRGFLPVVVDVETGGFDYQKDALLEIAAVLVDFDSQDQLKPVETIHCHIKPFEGSNIDPKALEITGIDPYHPLRPALEEVKAVDYFFGKIRKFQKEKGCNRCILVGHNAFFDLNFINQFALRTNYKHNPFHQFSTIDTVSLGALAYGQTVLAKVAIAAGMGYDHNEAHGAKYDTELTAKIFCQIVNLWNKQNGDLIYDPNS